MADNDYLNSMLSCLGQCLWFQLSGYLYSKSSLVIWHKNNGCKYLVSWLSLFRACLLAFFPSTYYDFHLYQMPRAGKEVDPGDTQDLCLRERSESVLVTQLGLWPHGLSMEFSRQEYWSIALPFSRRIFPTQGIKPGSPALQTYFLPPELRGKPGLNGVSK